MATNSCFHCTAVKKQEEVIPNGATYKRLVCIIYAVVVFALVDGKAFLLLQLQN